MLDTRISGLAFSLAQRAQTDAVTRDAGAALARQFAQFGSGPDGNTFRAAAYLQALGAADVPDAFARVQKAATDSSVLLDLSQRGQKLDAAWATRQIQSAKQRAATDPAFRQRFTDALKLTTPVRVSATDQAEVVAAIKQPEYPPPEKGVETDWVATVIIGAIIALILL